MAKCRQNGMYRPKRYDCDKICKFIDDLLPNSVLAAHGFAVGISCVGKSRWTTV